MNTGVSTLPWPVVKNPVRASEPASFAVKVNSIIECKYNEYCTKKQSGKAGKKQFLARAAGKPDFFRKFVRLRPRPDGLDEAAAANRHLSTGQ
jgi:hypothetical protein